MENKKNETLFDALSRYSASGVLPMHMPGHKRAEGDECLSALGAAYDITEIHGFDNLASPHGILRDAMSFAAQKWGADSSFFLINGSTEGILAGIYAATGCGSKIIMARNCHKSVYNAAMIFGLTPVYVMPEYDALNGIFASLSPAEIEKALDENDDARLVVITSPTYEGVISDISSIAEICHAHRAALMVDEAHGAHLGLSGYFPAGAVRCGADITVQSLHKTLSSLTQTAIMHVSGSMIDMRKVSFAVSVFGSSSPSYLLMASIDNCIKKLDDSVFCKWRKAIDANAEAFSALAKFRVLGYDGLKTSCIYKNDPSKLTVFTNGTDISGFELAGTLRDSFRIEVEMACPDYIVAMTGAGDSTETVKRFADAISEIDINAARRVAKSFAVPKIPEAVFKSSEAAALPSEYVSAENAEGRISAEFIMAYPPGVPLAVPGERLTRETLDALASQHGAGAGIISTGGRAPDSFSVIR